MTKHIVVIGGGVAGLESAGQLARAGFRVTLIEKEPVTGGHLARWYKLFPDRRHASEVKEYLDRMTGRKEIAIMADSTVDKVTDVNSGFSLTTSNGDIIAADAVVVATGFDLFKSEKKEEYGYGIYDNVITSADLELMFSERKVVTSEGIAPGSIGMVHCVGSRDEKSGNLYCSKLCCVTAVKQAIEIKELLPASKIFCFYMDMRMGGAHYEELYREAQEKWGVSFIRGKVSEASEAINNKIVVKVEDTLAGRPMKMELDLLVLMAGMEMAREGKRIAGLLQLRTGENRFLAPADHHHGVNSTNIKGVFLAGACTAPMNITETISHARAAVLEVIDYFRNE